MASAPTQIDVPQMYVRETPVTIHIFFGIMVPRNAGRFLVYGKNYDGWMYSIYSIKIEIQSSCEIEHFVETHLCKLCVILRSR